MDNFSFPVLHEDAELLAVAKPAGLLVHPSRLDAHEERSALKLLRDARGEWLWPLHRLDKGTSGVLLFARHQEAARVWGPAFEQGRVAKRYLALVRGWPPECGEIDQPLARDPELPSQGQERIEARTRYRRLACFEWPFAADARHATSRYALVEVEPLTGRRHQIRRHFKHIAHPLVGDTTHGKGAHNRAVAQWLGVSRLWLHAAAVQLPRAEGVLRIEAPCGAEWDSLLAAAGSLRACNHSTATGLGVLTAPSPPRNNSVTTGAISS
jgi:tRNA pseudouridine65 synthase